MSAWRVFSRKVFPMFKALPHPRFFLFLVVLVAGGGLASLVTGAAEAVVLGFDAATLVFGAASLLLWLDDHPDKVRVRAARDDGGRVLLLIVSAISLAVVLLALGRMIESRAVLSVPSFALIVGTLVAAWLFVNIVFAFHYSHMFYDQAAGVDVGGLAFPGTQAPIFADFCYFSFVVGMTSQVSDVQILTRSLRRVATVHGLFAFFFNLGVLALTINVLSGVL